MKNALTNITYFLLAVLAVSGYLFFRHLRNERNMHYSGLFPDVTGLSSGTPVYMKGVPVGRVTDIVYQENADVQVFVTLSPGTPVTEGTVARLESSPGFGSGKNILLIPGRSSVIIAEESVLPTTTDTTLIQNPSLRVRPIINSFNGLLYSMDSGLVLYNGLLKRGLAANAVNAVQGLDARMQRLSAASAGYGTFGSSVAAPLASLEQSTGKFAQRNASVDRAIHKADQSLESAARSDIRGSLSKADTLLHRLPDFKKASWMTDRSAERLRSLSASLAQTRQSLERTRSNPQGLRILSKKKKPEDSARTDTAAGK